MGYIPFKDISYAQGRYDMASNTDPIIFIRMSHGDGSLAYDTQAARNYALAASAGKAICGYHFAGGGSPLTEAAFFLGAMTPLAENDVMALDWEIEHSDPVGWCLQFVTYIHDQCGVWPLLYLDIDRLNRFDWSPVLQNCALWLAAPSFGFDETIPMVHHPYLAQQGPIVNGVDTDAWFDTLDVFRAYGFHKPAVAPQTTTTTTITTTTTTSSSTSSTTSTSISTTTSSSTSSSTTTLPPVIVGPQPLPWWHYLWDFILKVLYRRHV